MTESSTPQPPEVVIIRHARERISKCSLRHLHDRPGFTFHKAIKQFEYDASGYLELAVDAEPLTIADQGRPLLLLDSTWRLLDELRNCVTGETIRRSIPSQVKTAYPRSSRYYEDPDGGLASIEALYVALTVLGYEDETLLDGYHWKDEFLSGYRTRT